MSLIPCSCAFLAPIRNAVLAAVGIVALLSSAGTAQAQVCALPGSEGDATIAGTVNTYWTPAGGNYSGSGSIALNNQRGATTTLAEGDVVLVIQMQCAGINASDSVNYGDGAGG